jgi:hypothetical protein
MKHYSNCKQCKSYNYEDVPWCAAKKPADPTKYWKWHLSKRAKKERCPLNTSTFFCPYCGEEYEFTVPLKIDPGLESLCTFCRNLFSIPWLEIGDPNIPYYRKKYAWSHRVQREAYNPLI